MTMSNEGPPRDRMATIPLAVLFGCSTASAAEDFLIMIYGLKEGALTPGQRSFASKGQHMFLDLPGGGSARICTKKDTCHYGRIFVGIGINPDMEINPIQNDCL